MGIKVAPVLAKKADACLFPILYFSLGKGLQVGDPMFSNRVPNLKLLCPDSRALPYEYRTLKLLSSLF
jgi:hypothetical protein